MEVVDFLHLGIFFRVFMVAFLAHEAWVLYRVQNDFWKAPATMALVYVCWTWVNIPLVFHTTLTYDYQIMHALFMLTANALRILAVGYLPQSENNAHRVHGGVGRWKWWLLGIYALIALMLISNLGMIPDVTEPQIALMYQSVDLTTSALSMLIYSWFLWKSYRFLWPHLADNAFFGFLLLLANGITVYLMSSALLEYSGSFSALLKFFSYVLFFLWTIIQLWYFQSLSLFFRVGSKSMELAARANRLEVQSTTGVHLIWKQGVYRVGIKVLKTDGSAQWHWVERNKLNKTLGHWLAFALATKSQEQLTHGDMNVIKFRMLELWNKASDQVIQQKHLFEGQRGAYGFICQPGQVTIEIAADLLPNTLIKDALLDFDHIWIASEAFKKANLGKSKVRQEEDAWLQLLVGNFVK